jgi:hypothetical protein
MSSGVFILACMHAYMNVRTGPIYMQVRGLTRLGAGIMHTCIHICMYVYIYIYTNVCASSIYLPGKSSMYLGAWSAHLLVRVGLIWVMLEADWLLCMCVCVCFVCVHACECMRACTHVRDERDDVCEYICLGWFNMERLRYWRLYVC